MSFVDYGPDYCHEPKPRNNCCLFRCCQSPRPKCYDDFKPDCNDFKPKCPEFRPRCCCLPKCCFCCLSRCCCHDQRPKPKPIKADIDGVQVQLQGLSGGTVANNANVIFDTVINDTSSSISYDNLTGVFTINRPGNYLVNWWVNADGAEALTNITFSAEINGVSVGGTSPSPMTTLQLYGQAFFTVDDTPAFLSLVNRTGATVNYGIANIQADLVIVEL